MPDGLQRIYWDANPFLSYINGDPDRLPVLDALLDSASKGEDIEIVTSTISIAEVAFGRVEQTRQALDPAVERALDELWSDRSAIKLVDFDQLIARDARALMRTAITQGRRLQPADATHLASARSVGATEFHTYDQGLYKYASDVGFTIRAPFTAKPRLLP